MRPELLSQRDLHSRNKIQSSNASDKNKGKGKNDSDKKNDKKKFEFVDFKKCQTQSYLLKNEDSVSLAWKRSIKAIKNVRPQDGNGRKHGSLKGYKWLM